jgi:hypothetical protein
MLVIAVLGLIAAWMLVLKPKEEPAAPVTAPGVTGLTNAVDQAKGAAAAQEARDGQVQAAPGAGTAPAAKPAPGAQPAKAAKGDLPLPVLKAIADEKVLVLLFWNPKSPDDRAVKRAVARTDRWGGDVFVRTANVDSVSRYGKITRGADVDQSPTVVVVDRKLKAESLVGYVDTRSVDQAVVDAFRNSGVLIKDRYLRSINDACATAGVQQTAIPSPSSPAEVQPTVERGSRVWKRFMTRFEAIPAPAKWRALKRGSVRDGAAMSANYSAWLGYLGASPSAARTVSSLGRYNVRGAKLTKSWNARMDKHNVLSCGAQT